MSTGDLKNHGTRLQSLLRTTKYPNDIDYASLFYGYPQEYLPLVHYLFQDYSLSFSKYLLKRGYEMSGKSDKEFIDVVYKVLRDEFHYVPKLGKEKFFCNGYTEQKLILTCSAYQYVIEKCRSARKLKSKGTSNKENKNPAVAKSSKMDKNPVQHKETPSLVNPDEEHSKADCPEPCPISSVPKPNISQPLEITDAIEASIIQTDNAPSLCGSETEDRTLVYSEEGAKEIFALDHLAASNVDVINSSPHTVITNVQVVNVPDKSSSLPVTVTREPNISEHPARTGNPVSKCSAQCCHASDLADIKQLLATMNARLDILEAKVKHQERYGLSYTPHVYTHPSVNMPSMSNQVPDGPEAHTKHDDFLQKSVTFSEPEFHGPSISVASSVSESVETSAHDAVCNEEEEDIKSFIKSVQEKLNNTRTFLRTYDTS